MNTTLKDWLGGIIAAVSGGAGSALSAAFVDPSDFNFDTGLEKLVKVAAVSAFITLLAYLKQRPLPGVSENK